MKKLLLLFALMATTITANAQFQESKLYLGADISSLDLGYSKNSGASFKIDGDMKAGYFLRDNVLAYAQLGLALQKGPNEFSLGAGGRYYMSENGIFLGAGLKYIHADVNYNDLMPQLEVGYAFFINRTVTIEPSVYYNQSFNNMDYSRIGVKVGIGLYLDENKKLTKFVNDLW